MRRGPSAEFRRARLAGAVFKRAMVWTPAMELTKEQAEEGLRRAREGLDAFGHRPAVDARCCEDCGRPDWEALGDCLARVRAAANPLGNLAMHLDTMENALTTLIRDRRDVPADAVWAIRDAREILARQGVTAAGYREWLEERKRERARSRSVTR